MTYRTARITGTVTWSNGTLFDGYAQLGLVLPTDYYDSQWPSVALPGLGVRVRIPQWVNIPITQGAYNANIKVLFNADITPPLTRYIAYFSDMSGKIAGGPTPVFTVNVDPYPLVQPTITVPLYGVAIPSPDTPVTYSQYYIDATDGNDANDGNVEYPWKTTTNINSITPGLGVHIYYRLNSSYAWVDVTTAFPWLTLIPISNWPSWGDMGLPT